MTENRLQLLVGLPDITIDNMTVVVVVAVVVVIVVVVEFNEAYRNLLRYKEPHLAYGLYGAWG